MLLVVLAPDRNQVAVASLGKLALDAGHPGAAGAAVRTNGMQQDAGVADVLATIGLLAPPILYEQVVIAVGLLGRGITEAVARDMELSVGHAKYVARIGTLGVLEPGGQACKILAVEELNRFARSDRLPLLFAGRKIAGAEQESRHEPGVAADHCRFLHRVTPQEYRPTLCAGRPCPEHFQAGMGTGGAGPLRPQRTRRESSPSGAVPDARSLPGHAVRQVNNGKPPGESQGYDDAFQLADYPLKVHPESIRR